MSYCERAWLSRMAIAGEHDDRVAKRRNDCFSLYEALRPRRLRLIARPSESDEAHRNRQPCIGWRCS